MYYEYPRDKEIIGHDSFHTYLTGEFTSPKNMVWRTYFKITLELYTSVSSNCAHSLTCYALPYLHTLEHYFLCFKTIHTPTSIWLTIHPLKIILDIPFSLKPYNTPSHRIATPSYEIPQHTVEISSESSFAYCIIIMCLHDSPSCDLLMGTVISLRAVINLTHPDILNIQHKARDWQHHKYLLNEQGLTSDYNQWKAIIKMIHAPIFSSIKACRYNPLKHSISSWLGTHTLGPDCQCSKLYFITCYLYNLATESSSGKWVY